MQRQCGEGSRGWGIGGDYLLLTYLVSYFLMLDRNAASVW